jgi:hypothetical protein
MGRPANERRVQGFLFAPPIGEHLFSGKGKMKKLSIEFSLPTEIRNRIDALIDARGVCHCGRIILHSDIRGLLSQPNSYKMGTRAGKMTIVALCENCFSTLRDTYRNLKSDEREKSHV